MEADRMEEMNRIRGKDVEFHRRMVQILSEPTPESTVKAEDKPLPLDELLESWMKLPHARKRSTRYIERARSVLKAFSAFAGSKKVRRADHVEAAVAEGYLVSLRERGATPGTSNAHLILLRGVFGALAGRGAPEKNPFSGLPLRQDSPIHRRPLDPDEVDRVIAACDKIIRGPVITSVNTALRRTDACLLKWASVDLKAGFIVVATAKTGEMAEIPIFPELRKAIEEQAGKLKKTPPEDRWAGFVWPAAAQMLESNPAGISYRIRQAFDRAGVERRVEREEGVKKWASVGDFHAFRTTWITRALTQGVPMELVRRVTGHTTLNVVLKHYFRPDRKAFAKALAGMER
jgi:integrase